MAKRSGRLPTLAVEPLDASPPQEAHSKSALLMLAGTDGGRTAEGHRKKSQGMNVVKTAAPPTLQKPTMAGSEGGKGSAAKEALNMVVSGEVMTMPGGNVSKAKVQLGKSKVVPVSNVKHTKTTATGETIISGVSRSFSENDKTEKSFRKMSTNAAIKGLELSPEENKERGLGFVSSRSQNTFISMGSDVLSDENEDDAKANPEIGAIGKQKSVGLFGAKKKRPSFKRMTSGFTRNKNRRGGNLSGDARGGAGPRAGATFIRDLAMVKFAMAYDDQAKGWRGRLMTVVDGAACQVVAVICTILALFVHDAAHWLMVSDDSFFLVYIVLSFCFLFFFLEFSIRILAQPKYDYTNLLFWVDLVGTLSIIPDIGIIWPAEFSSSGLAAARFARTARAVRLFRIFRVIRVVRLLRVFHLLQALNRLIFHQSMANKLEAGDEDDALATALGQKHAESIERRVVFIVLLIMFVSPFLEAPVYDLSRAQGLLSVQATNNMMEEAKGWFPSHAAMSCGADWNNTNGLCGLEASLNVSAKVYFEEQKQLTLVSVRRLKLEREPAVRRVKWEVTPVPFEDASWPDIRAEYDYSAELSEAASFNICMTFFVSFVFAFGAFIFNQHAQKAILSPMKKLTDITKSLAGTIFGAEEADIKGHEAEYIAGVLSKLSRFFTVVSHKETTIYAPPMPSADSKGKKGGKKDVENTVWSIIVKKETEKVSHGIGSSHRITYADLQNMREGAQKKLVRNLMFKDFLGDPQAKQYFSKWALVSSRKKAAGSQRSPKAGNKKSAEVTSEAAKSDALLFWIEASRFKKLSTEALLCAKGIRDRYTHPASALRSAISGAIDLDKSASTQEKVVTEQDTVYIDELIGGEYVVPVMYDMVQTKCADFLRDQVFGDFCESDVFVTLMNTKLHQSKAVVFEQEIEDHAKYDEPSLMNPTTFKIPKPLSDTTLAMTAKIQKTISTPLLKVTGEKSGEKPPPGGIKRAMTAK